MLYIGGYVVFINPIGVLVRSNNVNSVNQKNKKNKNNSNVSFGYGIDQIPLPHRREYSKAFLEIAETNFTREPQLIEAFNKLMKAITKYPKECRTETFDIFNISNSYYTLFDNLKNLGANPISDKYMGIAGNQPGCEVLSSEEDELLLALYNNGSYTEASGGSFFSRFNTSLREPVLMFYPDIDPNLDDDIPTRNLKGLSQVGFTIDKEDHGVLIRISTAFHNIAKYVFHKYGQYLKEFTILDLRTDERKELVHCTYTRAGQKLSSKFDLD